MNAEQQTERPVRYLIADTETCGLGEHKKACEVAHIEIDPVTLEIIEEWDSLIDPQHPIQPGAFEVHGISDAMVADAPTMQEYKDIVLAGEFDDCDVVFIAHNASFDIGLCTPLYTVTRTVCTLTWARRLIPKGENGLENHKLGTLHEHFGYPKSLAHRALADCHSTRHVLKDLLHRSGMTLEQFARSGEHKVYVMPWGQKYAGRLIAELPLGYLKWLWNLDDLEPNLRESVKDVLKSLHGFKVTQLKPGMKLITEIER